MLSDICKLNHRIQLITSVKKSMNDCIESAINVEKENTIPKTNFKDATIAFNKAVNIITFLSFIFILLINIYLLNYTIKKYQINI